MCNQLTPMWAMKVVEYDDSDLGMPEGIIVIMCLLNREECLTADDVVE